MTTSRRTALRNSLTEEQRARLEAHWLERIRERDMILIANEQHRLQAAEEHRLANERYLASLVDQSLTEARERNFWRAVKQFWHDLFI